MVEVELHEGGSVSSPASSFVGELQTVYLQLLDHDGSPVDITTGTLTASYVNSLTGAAYTFPSGTATLTKVSNPLGIVSLLNPSAYPSSARVRVVVTFTNGAVIRKFGPMIVGVQLV